MKHYTKKRHARTNPTPVVEKEVQQEIRFAVINGIHVEVLSAHHRVIGEAFNSMNEGYVSTNGRDISSMLLVAAHTVEGKILGAVNHRGELRKTSKTLPDTIWGGERHPYFDPGMNYGPRQKTPEEVAIEADQLAQSIWSDLDNMTPEDIELSKKMCEALDQLEKKNETSAA